MLGVVSRLKRRFHFFHGEGEVSWGSCDLYGLLYRVSYCIEFHFVSYHSFVYLSWSLTSSRNPTQGLAKFLLPHLPSKSKTQQHLSTSHNERGATTRGSKMLTSFQAILTSFQATPICSKSSSMRWSPRITSLPAPLATSCRPEGTPWCWRFHSSEFQLLLGN